jgi:hypothetical protein
MYSIYRSEASTFSLRQTWNQADEQQQRAIFSASHQIDEELKIDPHKKGESRPGRKRVLFQAPLAVLYRVDHSRKLVRIIRTWTFTVRTRKPDPAE